MTVSFSIVLALILLIIVEWSQRLMEGPEYGELKTKVTGSFGQSKVTKVPITKSSAP